MAYFIYRMEKDLHQPHIEQIFKIYSKHKRPDIKRTNNPIKWGTDLKQRTLNRASKTSERHLGNAQYPLPSEKCKSKQL